MGQELVSGGQIPNCLSGSAFLYIRPREGRKLPEVTLGWRDGTVHWGECRILGVGGGWEASHWGCTFSQIGDI